MALRHAILAALLDGEASGYQLSKRFDIATANYWAATPTQLYRELERLEAAGLLTARIVEQERRPNKRVFTVTDAGHDELLAFVAGPTRPAALRDELLVKVVTVGVGNTDGVAAAVAERMEQSRGKLALYDRNREKLLAGRTEEEYLREAERIGNYLTLMRGRLYEQENLAWGQSVLEILAQRAGVRFGEGREMRRPDAGSDDHDD
jgi:DNA-binding PadR family transcriptional regulator